MQGSWVSRLTSHGCVCPPGCDQCHPVLTGSEQRDVEEEVAHGREDILPHLLLHLLGVQLGTEAFQFKHSHVLVGFIILLMKLQSVGSEARGKTEALYRMYVMV